MKKTEEKYLDKEEKNLIESLEKSSWKPVNNLGEWKSLLVKAANNTISKDRRMNIRISQKDLEGIKLRAMEEGLPYQTLVASILHKYLTGRLIEKEILVRR